MSGKSTLQWRASIDRAQQPQHAASDGENRPTKALAPQHKSAGVPNDKKSVLLVDSNQHSRESRAKVMRTMRLRVDCVASAYAARVRLASEKYNLILVDLGQDVAAAELLVSEIKSRNSRQLVRYLVGSPLFMAQSLGEKPNTQISVGPRSTAKSVPELEPPGDDFGQRIRYAEAEQEKRAS